MGDDTNYENSATLVRYNNPVLVIKHIDKKSPGEIVSKKYHTIFV